jgi:hypothetical protein
VTQDSYLWTTGGAGDGSATFTRSDWSKIAKIFSACLDDEGVAPNYLSQFVGSVPAANTFRVAAGAALVDGKAVYSDANIDTNIPSAVGGGNTRIDRIVLRADWTAQTVRVFRIAGVDAASPTPPAITQNSGTTYDIMLYQVRVNTSGTVTIELDERVFANLATATLKDGAVTAAKIADGATLSEILDDDGAGSLLDADKLDGVEGSGYALAAAGVTNGNSHDHNGGDGAVIPAGGIASGAVSDVKIGNRVPTLTKRLGGDTTQWNTPGGSTYIPGLVSMLGGATRWTGGAASSGSLTIDLPLTFAGLMLVFAMVINDAAINVSGHASSATSQIVLNWSTVDGSTRGTVDIQWLVVGPG